MINAISQQVGVVVIGRNEGERLITCLNSLKRDINKIVYVDSGSTDHSLTHAEKLGVTVVNLDLSLPFTAARARNAGLEKLTALDASLKYVQFVDGDCEVVEGWLSTAFNYLEANSEVAVVCGRRRERFPHASIYNQLCDIEWDTPVGEAKACGGDAMMRIDCFKSLNGYREGLIAGEEPELCVRIRQSGYKVWRLDSEMTLHDAAITKFSQWWKRTTRAGHAYAEGAYLHGNPPEYHWVRESRRAWLWGGVIPLFFVLCLLISPLVAVLFILLYGFQFIKLTYQNKRMSSFSPIYAIFLMVGKFAEMVGQMTFYWHRVINKRPELIEYK
jgi:glycosyltransferase involved in cell wall biosynthesis